MSQIHFINSRKVLQLLALATFASSFSLLHAQEAGGPQLSAETLAELSRNYNELRNQDPELEAKTTDEIAQDFQVIARVWRERRLGMEQASAIGVHGSVSTAVRCDVGYVQQGTYSVSDRTVTVTSESSRECDSLGCRSYEVTAISESSEPFDLNVSVDCSN
jgi:hypothetical protein